MIKRIRKGNNIQVNWIVSKNQNSRDLSEDSLQLYLVDALKKKTEITDFQVSGNVISFVFLGKNQCHLNSGKFSLLLIANRCTDEQFVLDKQDVFILLDKLDGKVETGNDEDNLSVETLNIISEAVTGQVAVDLSRYYTKNEIDEMFSEIGSQKQEDEAAMNEKNGQFNHTLGMGLITTNTPEVAVGKFNQSNENTIFSVGTGSSDNIRNNAFEIKSNGDILLRLGNDIVRLQDIILVTEDKKIKFVGSATENDIEGLVTLDELNSMDYAQKAWVTQQIVNAITEGQVDLSGYVSKNELNSYGFAYMSDINELRETISGFSYVTQDTLNDYITKEELSSLGYITSQQDLSEYVSYSYLRSKKYVNTDDIALMGYITSKSIPDLSSYVQKSYITSNYYNKTDVNNLVLEQIQTNFVEKDLLFKSHPAYTITNEDIDKWNTPVNLSSYATKEYVNDKIENIQPQDLTPYVTHNQLSRIGYLTQHQSLDDYATKSYVINKIDAIPQPDLTPYITKEEVSSMGYLTEHQSLNGYATESYVNEKVNAIPQPDLTPYVSYTYLESRLDNIVTDEQDPVFTASPANNITNENINVISKLQYSNAFKKLEFNSESDANDGFLATENYVLDQISQKSNLVIKLTRSQFEFLQSQGLVDENKIYMITDEDDTVVHENDLNDYATLSYVTGKFNGYYTKAEVESLIANAGSGGTIDLTGYATQSWVQDYITALNLANKVYVQSQVNTALQQAKDYADTISTQGIDLTDYVQKTYLNSKLNNYATLSDIPDVSGLAARTWVNNNFATKSDLQNIDYNNIDLSNYISKSELSSCGYLTQHQSLNGYATESYVNEKINAIPSVDLTGYATESYVISKINDLDINSYATKTYVLEKINAATGTDLSKYVSKQELSSCGYITEHQSLNGYATESYVQNKISSLNIPEEIDLTPYATKSYVVNKIDAIEMPTMPDLSDYATKTYVMNKVNSISIPDMNNYATKTYVVAKISEITSGNIIWTGTQAQYDALSDKSQYQIYLIKE